MFIPNFVEIKSINIPEIMESFRENGMKFPCVCKPLIAQGSSDAHKVHVININKSIILINFLKNINFW